MTDAFGCGRYPYEAAAFGPDPNPPYRCLAHCIAVSGTDLTLMPDLSFFTRLFLPNLQRELFRRAEDHPNPDIRKPARLDAGF